jgi:coenzyme F420-reducing hydrogenase beta subunit
MITIERKEDCCGCSACMAACPVDAIQMTADDEGFQYPQIDMEKCINCGKCDRVCPIKNPVPEISQEQKAYLFQLKDKKLRMDSTSGGAFTAIAGTILREGGVVFGAAYDENLQVIHTYVEKEADLWRFRNSKYVQSNVQNSFRQVKDFLQQGRKVCFSGTPCQVEGLNSYLKNVDKKQNLILVDLVCRAVPSPLLWKKYVAWQQERLGKEIGNIRFRDKRHYGYKYSQMVIEDKAGNVIYHSGVESDPYLRAFFSNLSDRPSCYECKFKKRYRVSDMTIWDCFDVGLKDKDFDDDLGTTNVLIHNLEKENVINENMQGVFKEITADKCVYGMRELIQSVTKNNKRREFFDTVESKKMDEICLEYFPDNSYVKLKRMLRVILFRTGIYGVCKKCLMMSRKWKTRK